MINEFRPMNHLTSLQNFICTIGNLPTSYALSLSYEEQIWWLCDFLEKKVFPAIEENTNITEETQQAFIELQNYVRDYFNNLDVQEEINNKLDEMAESGTLQEIINAYLQSNCLWIFNNIHDMKETTNLIVGSKCKTLGYYSINDGGSATYLIRERTYDDIIDNGQIHLISEHIVAELIFEDYVKPEVFGAVGDGVTDDTTAIENMLLTKKPVKTSKIYKISRTINIDNSIEMNGNSYFKADETLTDIVVNVAKDIQQIGKTYNINVDASGITETAIAVGRPKKSILDLKVINAGHTGINANYYSAGGNNENQFTCNVAGNTSGTTEIGVYVNNYDSIYHAIVTKDCKYGVYLNHGELIATSVHSWLSNEVAPILWDNSCVIYNAGYFNSIITWLYQDSVKYGINGIAPYGQVTYFEYLMNLENANNYNNYINFNVSSGPARFTIDRFKNNFNENQLLKYSLASDTNATEFGVLNKNGVTAKISNIQDLPTFNDVNNAPQLGSFYCKYDVLNLPLQTNGFLISQIVGSCVIQEFYPTNFSSNCRYWKRLRSLESDSWSDWFKFIPEATT